MRASNRVKNRLIRPSHRRGTGTAFGVLSAAALALSPQKNDFSRVALTAPEVLSLNVADGGSSLNTKEENLPPHLSAVPTTVTEPTRSEAQKVVVEAAPEKRKEDSIVDNEEAFDEDETFDDDDEEEDDDEAGRRLFTDEKGQVNKNLKAAYEKALAVAGPETRLRLKHHPSMKGTIKLTKKWDVDKLLELHHDFQAILFFDQMLLFKDTLDKFRKKYRSGSLETQALLEDIPQFCQDLDYLKSLRRQFDAFRWTNVHLYNSEGRYVDSYGMGNFNEMCNFNKELGRAVADIEQVLRAMTVAEFKKVLDHPAAKPFLPYFKQLRADYSADPEQLNYAETAAKAAFRELDALENRGFEFRGQTYSVEELISLVHAEKDREKQDSLIKDIQTVLIPAEELRSKFLRWKSYIYSARPGNLLNPSSKLKTEYHNILLNMRSNTGEAILQALATDLDPLYERYIKVLARLNEATGALPKEIKSLLPDEDKVKKATLIETHLFNPVIVPNLEVQPEKAETLTWQETHEASAKLVQEFAPCLGAQVPKLWEEGRILWETAKKDYEKRAAAHTEPGGRRGPVVLCEYDDGNDRKVPLYATVYARAAAYMSQEKRGLLPPIRDLALDALLSEAADYFQDQYPVCRKTDHLRLANAIDRLYRGPRSLKIAHTYDAFETALHIIVDQLGAIGTVRVKNKATMPAVPVLQEAWSKTVDRLNTPQINCNAMKIVVLPRSYPLLTDKMSHPALLGRGLLFLADRSNYSQMVQYLLTLAIRDALRNEDGSFKSAEVREQITRAIVNAPSSSTFDDYVKMIGGTPSDPEYWCGVLRRAYVEDFNEAEKLLDKAHTNPKELNLSSWEAFAKSLKRT